MTMLWIAAAALVLLLVAWRLRRADHTLRAILREERERPPAEPTADEPVSHWEHRPR